MPQKSSCRIHCPFVSMVKLIWTKKAVQLIFGEFFKRLVHFQSWPLTYFEYYITEPYKLHILSLSLSLSPSLSLSLSLSLPPDHSSWVKSCKEKQPTATKHYTPTAYLHPNTNSNQPKMLVTHHHMQTLPLHPASRHTAATAETC